MSRIHLIGATLLCALISQLSHAAPILTVTPNGLIGGNRQWLVQATPDPSLFSNNPPQGFGGSLAVELAFAVDDAELLSVDVNTAVWDRENPGFNPFTNTITEGLWLDQIGDRTFGAFGSFYFTSAMPVRLFTIVTSADLPATMRYGEAASGTNTKGNLIIQAGTGFKYTGSVTANVPEPASIAILALVGLFTICSKRVRV